MSRRFLLVILIAAIVGCCAQFSRAAATDQASPPPNIDFDGFLSSKQIVIGEDVRFSLTARNPPAAAGDISCVWLFIPPNDYEFRPSPSVPAPTCQPNPALQSPPGAPVLFGPISKDQSSTVVGDLHPRNTHNSETVSIVVAYYNGKILSTRAVKLGENKVLSTIGSIWSSASDPLKALAVPVILVLLGYLFNKKVQQRDELNRNKERERDELNRTKERERDEENRREERARDELTHQKERERDELNRNKERLRTFRSDTWKEMLPISHEVASKYYLPLSLASERAAEQLKLIIAEHGSKMGKNTIPLAFFYLILAGKRMDETRKQTGGFYFKDLTGEALAGACWKSFRETFMGKEEEDRPLFHNVKGCVALIAADDDFETFSARFPDFTNESPRNRNRLEDSHGLVWKTYGLFREWLADLSAVTDVVLYLLAFRSILDYEANRPYEYWYDVMRPMMLDEKPDPGARKKMIEAGQKQAELSTEELEGYLEKALQRRLLDE